MAAGWIQEERRKLFPAPAADPASPLDLEQLETRVARLEAQAHLMSAAGYAATISATENPLMQLVPDIVAKVTPELRDIMLATRDSALEARLSRLDAELQRSLKDHEVMATSLAELWSSVDRRGAQRPREADVVDTLGGCLEELRRVSELAATSEARLDALEQIFQSSGQATRTGHAAALAQDEQPAAGPERGGQGNAYVLRSALQQRQQAVCRAQGEPPRPGERSRPAASPERHVGFWDT